MSTSSAFGGRSTADDVLRDRHLQGQNVLVTGPSAGIGFETARSLAAHGAHVILGVRGPGRAEQVAARIREQHPDAQLSPLELDLASFASVRAAAAAVPVEALHVLVCNAGLYATSYGETEDGLERTVGICHFGHFLLTRLLLERLKAAQGARVVMVSSESHRSPSRLNFDKFPLQQRQFRALTAYGQAKLCNVLFANELDRRAMDGSIRACSLHPGSIIATSIFRESLPVRVLSKVIRPFTKSIAQGAATSVYCATSPAMRGGRYYADCREKPMSAGARDAEAARRLWELSEARVGLA